MAERAIDLEHAKSQLLELVRQAAHGDDVLLTVDGEPVAKIIPIAHTQARRQFGSARGLIRMADDFDEPLDAFSEYM